MHLMAGQCSRAVVLLNMVLILLVHNRQTAHGNVCSIAMKLESVAISTELWGCTELSLVFGGDMQGQRAQQQVWSAWRGEASRESVLITEEQFEYVTIGTLYGPQHADFWRRLCEHRQLFTESGFAVVQEALERCSNGGDVLISSIANDAQHFVSSRLPLASHNWAIVLAHHVSHIAGGLVQGQSLMWESARHRQLLLGATMT